MYIYIASETRDEMGTFRFDSFDKIRPMPDKRTETVSAEKQKGGSKYFLSVLGEDPVSFTTQQNQVLVTSLYSSFCC